MMKKMLIFTKALHIGGIESSLINFLEYYSARDDLEITLLLLKKDGENLKFIPENIEIIGIPFKKEFYNIYENESTIKKRNRVVRKFYKLINKINYLLTRNNNKSYNYFLKKTSFLEKEYDVAIDYYGYGCFGNAYISKKVKAKTKIMWIHSAELNWTESIEEYLNDYDKIYCVSNNSKKLFLKKYSYLSDKTDIYPNMINYEKIKILSKKYNPEFDTDYLNILTVARLEKEKGYDIIINVAKKLLDKNVKFKWYIVGDGKLRNNIEKQINDLELENCVYLIGKKENPYPYFLNCDIYVQSSKIEGFGLTIAEAKVFHKPVICSKIPSFKEQIKDGKNGFLCDLNPDLFADKICYVYKNLDSINSKIMNFSEQEMPKNYDIIE